MTCGVCDEDIERNRIVSIFHKCSYTSEVKKKSKAHAASGGFLPIQDLSLRMGDGRPCNLHHDMPS